jgi:hypothetical protein
MKSRLAVIVLLAAISVTSGVSRAATAPPDISGTWSFSVDLDNGGHGDPTFVFTQTKEALTGSYEGPLGSYKVTGTIKDNKAVFGFEFSEDGQTRKAIYTGVVESATTMTGTLDLSGGPKGKWTATKK